MYLCAFEKENIVFELVFILCLSGEMGTLKTYVFNETDVPILARVDSNEVNLEKFDAGIEAGGVGAKLGVQFSHITLKAGFVRIPAGEHIDFQHTTHWSAFDVFISIYVQEKDGTGNFVCYANNLRKRVGNHVEVTSCGAIKNVEIEDEEPLLKPNPNRGSSLIGIAIGTLLPGPAGIAAHILGNM